MTNITIKQMPGFKRAYRNLHANQRPIVDEAIRALINNPEIGKEKRGDLTGVFVYKFKLHHQEMLLAYQWDPTQRILLALGVHENFYRDLKHK